MNCVSVQDGARRAPGTGTCAMAIHKARHDDHSAGINLLSGGIINSARDLDNLAVMDSDVDTVAIRNCGIHREKVPILDDGP